MATTTTTTASTPPPTSLRAHTPPAPLHGAQYDEWEPYSPRRSKRSTAHSNPYSSFNSDRNTTPSPKSQRRGKFSQRVGSISTHLSSPPSSPEPAALRAEANSALSNRQTPNRSAFKRTLNGVKPDLDGKPQASSHLHATDAHSNNTMLPTPSKTPRTKRQQLSTHGTARILSFQPVDPNDAMPTPRRMKAPSRKKTNFDLSDDDLGHGGHAAFDIYTDNANRVPELDGSDDNPFVGKREHRGRQPQRRSTRSRKSAALIHEEAEMDEAARRNEGIVYQFRGRKVFKRFSSPAGDETGDLSNPEEAPTDIEEGRAGSDSLDQRQLKRKAGAAAQRPLTRGNLKPRLLFPTQADTQQSDTNEDVDEEATTDIEMSNVHSTGSKPTYSASVTPIRGRFEDTEHLDEEPAAMLLSPPSTSVKKRGGKKLHSGNLFQGWARTKSSSRKRGNDDVGRDEIEGEAKRARSVVGSPI